MRVLVSAASKHGATAEIADAIGKELRSRGLDATVAPPVDAGEIERYDAVVLGSAVYAGHWLEPAKQLAKRWDGSFDGRPVWLFSSGPVGDPSRSIVQRMEQDPVDLAGVRTITAARDHHMFAGRLDRRSLSLPERAFTLVIRGMEGDFRDWDDVTRWAGRIAGELQPTA